MAGGAAAGQGGGVAGARAERGHRADRPAGRTPRALVVATLVAVGLALAAPSLGGAADRAGPPPTTATAAPGAAPAAAPGDREEVAALEVLRAWDAARAEAWADGDVEALGRLHAARTPTGSADVAALQAYLARGLVVVDLRSQVLAVDVITRSPRSWRLRVTDRLVDGRAVPMRDPDAEGVPLPGDAPTTREVLLVRTADGWVLQEVRRLT